VIVVVHKFIVGLCVALWGDRVLTHKFSDIRNMGWQTLYLNIPQPRHPAINYEASAGGGHDRMDVGRGGWVNTCLSRAAQSLAIVFRCYRSCDWRQCHK